VHESPDGWSRLVVAERPSATMATLAALELFRGEGVEVLEWVLRSCGVQSFVPGEVLLDLSARIRRNNAAVMQSHVQQGIHERDALCDPLTGLFNRRWMDRVLVRLVERCAEARHPLGLLMVDIDHFNRKRCWDWMSAQTSLTLLVAAITFVVMMVYAWIYFRNEMERTEMTARLFHLANHDALTGLANRNLLSDR